VGRRAGLDEVEKRKIPSPAGNKTIILNVVLYGCETWCVTLREDHRLRVSENRVLRGIWN
jgi:hypothetical protein